MLRTALRWLGSLAVGVLAVGVAYRFGVDLPVSAVIGLCVAASALVLARIAREYPDRMTGDSWADKRWTGLSVGVINLAALTAMWVPDTGEAGVGLGVLVLLVGLFGYATGAMAEMERDRSRGERVSGDPVPADD